MKLSVCLTTRWRHTCSNVTEVRAPHELKLYGPNRAPVRVREGAVNRRLVLRELLLHVAENRAEVLQTLHHLLQLIQGELWRTRSVRVKQGSKKIIKKIEAFFCKFTEQLMFLKLSYFCTIVYSLFYLF